jgi:hypothetical protein
MPAKKTRTFTVQSVSRTKGGVPVQSNVRAGDVAKAKTADKAYNGMDGYIRQ